MDKVIENLFDYSNANRVVTCYEEKIIRETERNNILLKKHLSKQQKKLLLRIVDGKDLINEISSMNSFADGFKLGLRLGIETYSAGD